MDTIIISDLEVWVNVGVPDAERALPQRLLISLELETDFVAAAASDDLQGTIDYYAVWLAVSELASSRPWKLIETLASHIATLVLDRFRPAAVNVEIKKFVLPQTRQVGVRLRRSR